MKHFRHIILFITFTTLIVTNNFAQVDADFSVSDSVGCTPSLIVDFQNEGSTGINFVYEWFFGELGTSEEENPTFEFNDAGVYEVKLITTDTSIMESDSITGNIEVFQTPGAAFSIDPFNSNLCVNGIVIFNINSFAAKDSAFWNFGDGTTVSNRGFQTVYHTYPENNVYPVSLYTYYKVCSDTSYGNATISGPVADFTLSDDEGCQGATIMFTLGDTNDVNSFSWNTGDGNILTGDSAEYIYDSVDIFNPSLTVIGESGTCTIVDTIEIIRVTAEFSTTGGPFCPGDTVYFNNESENNDNNIWDFGGLGTSIDPNPYYVFPEGTHTVRLDASNTLGCSDWIEHNVTVNSNPSVTMGIDPWICPGESVVISVTGGDHVVWSPETGLDDINSFTPEASPDETTAYTATVTDTETGCSNSGELTVYLREVPRSDGIIVSPADTTIFIGDSVYITTYDSLDRVLIYSWSPDIRISCLDCPNPAVQPLETQTYILEIADTNICFIPQTYNVNIEVNRDFVIGIPEAFTPNGDMINDIIMVDGRGIKQLIEFRVYNRSGKELFYSDNIEEGWDGYHEGKLQAIGTYAYLIKAEMWNDQIVTQQGTFNLIR
ncbi:MAG: gliding motility-associated C-terminal domain-containing protein [Bacteroidales bacterium]|nr:gliding motility-associated C-terminal domain-containing protein [Bacteroidales bacterium]